MKQVEARERDCEELLHNSASPMFSVDTNGRITEWNPAMVQLTGLEPFAAISKVVTGEIFGPRGLLKLMPSEGSSTDAETEISVLLLSVMEPDRVVADGVEQAELGAVDFCFAKSTSSGLQQVDIRLTCHQRVGSTGEMVGVYFYVQDLTLPKALEKAIAVQMAAEAAAEAKTRHIAFLCHEIRNPVNGILATVQAMDDMMLEDPKRGHSAINEMDAEELRDLVRTTLACTDQLRRTVDGILDINKLEEGKLDVAIGPFKAKSVLRTVCSQVKRAATEKGLTLDFELDPPELGSIWFLGDEGRIQQILSNFCWNSVKFTSEGGVRIVVEAEDGEHPGTKRVFWKVIDTGKGMTPETQESLFQRYAMGNHKVGKYGGSGLGLSICRSLADLMNGHVHCVSTLGKGSTFVLELDLEVDSQSHSVENQHITPGDMEEFRSSAAVARNARDESGGVCTKDKVLKPHQAVSSTSEAPMAGAQDVSPMSAVSSAQNQSASWPYQGQQPTSQPHPMTYAHPGPNWMEQPAAQFGPNMIYFDPPHMVHPSLALQQAVARLDAHSMMYMPSWSVSVVRELIHETSVAVLVELNIAGAQRQCWGGAQIGPAGVGHALAEANEDAILRGSTLIQAPWTPSPAYAFYPPEIPQTGGTIPVFSQDLAPSVFNRSVQQQVTMKPPSNVGDARVPLSCSQGEQHSLASAPLQHAPVQAPSRHGGVPASLPDGIPNVVQKMPELARPGSMPSQTQVASNSEGPSVVAAPSESLTPSNAAGPMLSSTQTDESSPDQPNSKCSNLKPRRKKLALKRPDASKADAAAASIQPGEEGAPMISVSGCAAPGSGGEANGIATTKLKWLLIVDDDAVNTKMMHRTFTRAGYDVTTGEDGGDVLRLCITEDRRYDIILLDENMRHMNGTVAARALRIHEKQRGIQHVPIIMTTGNTSPHDVAMYFSCGVDGVIEKPIDMRSFPQQLESYYAYRMASGAANFAELPLIADDCPRPTMGKPMARRNSEIFEQSMTFGSIEIFGNIKEGRGADAMQAVLSRFQGYEQRRRE